MTDVAFETLGAYKVRDTAPRLSFEELDVLHAELFESDEGQAVLNQALARVAAETRQYERQQKIVAAQVWGTLMTSANNSAPILGESVYTQPLDVGVWLPGTTNEAA